jgi:hypothetical protein
VAHGPRFADQREAGAEHGAGAEADAASLDVVAVAVVALIVLAADVADADPDAEGAAGTSARGLGERVLGRECEARADDESESQATGVPHDGDEEQGRGHRNRATRHARVCASARSCADAAHGRAAIDTDLPRAA